MLMRLFIEPYKLSGCLKWRTDLGIAHTFWHSSTKQSHKSSPHPEKNFSAYPTIFWMDCCELHHEFCEIGRLKKGKG